MGSDLLPYGCRIMGLFRETQIYIRKQQVGLY